MADRVQQVAIPAPVAELVAAWNDRSADRFVAILDPEVRVVVPPLHLELVGRDDVWLGVARLFGAFGALRYTSRHRYLTPNSVTDEALLEGLQTQEFLGAAPSNQPGAVAARVIMRHDDAVVTRLEVWPDVGTLRDLFEGVSRRIDLRSSGGAAAPVVAALRATIPAPEGKLSLGQQRQLPVFATPETGLLPGAPGEPGPGGTPGTPGAVAAEPARKKRTAQVPKAPLPRKVRRLRAILAGLAMLAIAGLLVTYVVVGVRNKAEPAAAPSPGPGPSAVASHRPSPKPSPSPSVSAPPVQFNKRTNSFSFKTSLLFKLNSAELLPEARTILDGVIAKVTTEKRYGKILVRGYTDNTGPAALNLALSRERAVAVARYLENQLPSDRFTVTPIGKGATNFTADNSTEEGRAKNRRVEIKVPKPQPQR